MRLRRLSHRLGTILAILGGCLIVYAGLVVFWKDPFTAAWTTYQQRELRGDLNREFDEWQARSSDLAEVVSAPPPEAEPEDREGGDEATPPAQPDRAAIRRQLARLARAYRSEMDEKDGNALGRIRAPRMGLSSVFVEGDDYWGSLSKGPGRFERTSFPGLGKTTAIAGHRTTFSAPFRSIDRMRKGDWIVLEMPYATLSYRVTTHKIVDNGDWSIIKEKGYDQLVLSACHPLYSAEQRWVVFAKLAAVRPRGSDKDVAV